MKGDSIDDNSLVEGMTPKNRGECLTISQEEHLKRTVGDDVEVNLF